MKIIKEIKVLDKGLVALIDYMGNDDSIIESARISYGDKENEKYKDIKNKERLIRYLMRNRHTSPFEMVEFKFYIKLPLFVMRQLVRHRTANINELSSRYVQLKYDYFNILNYRKNNLIYKQSSDIVENNNNIKEIENIISDNYNYCYNNYNDLINKFNLTKELSRIVIPLNQYTEIYWKIDLHNLFNFLKLRLDKKAQFEINQYAKAIYEIIKNIVPISCKAFEDYILNSITLSFDEIDFIKNHSDKIKSNNIDNIKNILKEKYNMGNSEIEDFIYKINKLFF